MVHATRGVLVTCDPAIKQFILVLDQEYHFGIMDLDETHLLLYNADNSTMEIIQKRIDDQQDKNTYELNQETRDKLFRLEFNS